ncbi:MAG TPA: c-type cytochrome, partial [Candidatus Acidoferrum sp.]|nr:c-type cytochrome [Candidatus Acidoferrum sp.]
MRLRASTLVLGIAAGLVGCGQQQSATNESKQSGGTSVANAALPAKITFSELPVPPKPAVTPELLARGKTVYAQNCAACHGMNGDGKGDAAAFLAPKPRNFVQANFRLRSTAPNNLPTDVDLFRQISLGSPGTPMPPWKHMLDENDRWALVEYVKSFSPRFSDTNEVRVAIADFGTPPARSLATIAEGKALYAKMNCFTCHGDKGRGDGES